MMTIEQLIALIRSSTQHRTFYHFTDSRNIPSIRKHGLLSMRKIRAQGMEVAPGGNDWSLDADQRIGMDAYVHLCWKDNNAMEYLARQDKRIETAVYLQVDPDVIRTSGTLVTNDVANKAGIVAEPAASMLDKIDLDVIYKRTDWRDAAIKERLKAADKCEILIPDHVPLKFILN